jgi:SsrA-binding protein
VAEGQRNTFHSRIQPAKAATKAPFSAWWSVTSGDKTLPMPADAGPPKTSHRPLATIIHSMARQSTHQTRPSPEKKPRRDPTAAGERDAAVNRNASHNYFLQEKFETGVALTGTEVKSVRAGLANLKDSYGLVKDDELWLLNCHIGPYEHGNIFNHAPLRTRKLLMHKEEIRKLIGKTQHKGLTLIPTRMYFKNGRVKVELALAKGKQLWDKRETERRRTADSEARAAIARSRKA